MTFDLLIRTIYSPSSFPLSLRHFSLITDVPKIHDHRKVAFHETDWITSKTGAL